MNMVREALGEDAIIVATHEEKGDNGQAQVKLTAAIDNDVAGDAASHEANGSWLYDDDSDEEMVIEALTDSLLNHGVPEEVLDQIISYASVMDHTEPRLALLSAVENMFQFSAIPTTPSAQQRPIILLGPPGAGKTLAAAKIAARGTMAGMNIAVITTDTERAGGQEQLKAFTKLMDIELQLAPTPKALQETLQQEQNKQADQIIIDTSGTNPFDTDHVRRLAHFTNTADMVPVLVLPAGYDAEEAGEIARTFANLGAKQLLSTRTDVARRLGSILSAAYYGHMRLTDIGTSAKVASGLSPLNAKRLTQLLMPHADGAKMKKSQISDSQSHATPSIMSTKSNQSRKNNTHKEEELTRIAG